MKKSEIKFCKRDLLLKSSQTFVVHKYFHKKCKEYNKTMTLPGGGRIPNINKQVKRGLVIEAANRFHVVTLPTVEKLKRE